MNAIAVPLRRFLRSRFRQPTVASKHHAHANGRWIETNGLVLVRVEQVGRRVDVERRLGHLDNRSAAIAQQRACALVAAQSS